MVGKSHLFLEKSIQGWMSMDSNGSVYIGPLPAEKKPPPLVLDSDSWQARMVRKAEMLHALGKPVIMVIRLGDCVPHWFKTISEK